jgi:Cu-Zn family superoxide dismutase
MKKVILIGVFMLLFGTLCYAEEGHQTARTELFNAQGEKVGSAVLTETPHGVLIAVELWNLPPGAHAFHIHATGKCEPPFTTAGGHFNPNARKHGFMNPEGGHAGDLPNAYVGADGKLKFEVLAQQVTLGKGVNSLFDEDGSSLVIHASGDNYKSDPAGDAGPRIACGVITK